MNIRIGLYGELSPYLDDEDDLIYFPDDELENGHSWGTDIDKYFKKFTKIFAKHRKFSVSHKKKALHRLI